ncbi:MAG: TIGR02444 family protein [Bacterioplanes sp.]|nr:TIGR02444 family protein [Bacterioplanes sp.]
MAAQCDTERSKKKSLINPLWTWSLSVYAKPNVAPTLLALQQQYEADVLVVLTALWLYRQQRDWPEGFADSLAGKAYAQWRQERILPARAERMALTKDTPERQQALARELEAEQYGMALLWQGLSGTTGDETTSLTDVSLGLACCPWSLGRVALEAEALWQQLLRLTADGG